MIYNENCDKTRAPGRDGEHRRKDLEIVQDITYQFDLFSALVAGVL